VPRQSVCKNDAWAKTLFQYHLLVGWVLMGLVGVHLLGTFVHGKVAHDNINSRMSLS
jgi:cytochrome b561